ncbi:methyltransferase-like protein 27 [Sebastes fasciatus]
MAAHSLSLLFSLYRCLHIYTKLSCQIRVEMEGDMASTQRTYETVKEDFSLFHSAATVGDKIALYDIWAKTYDQDMVVLGLDAAGHASKSISSHFSGDREAAVVLDVACGTGLVGEKMKQDGFGNFVGIDASKVMLEEAQKKGLYQDLKQCLLGELPLPVQKGSFDVVVICGALNANCLSVSVVRELCIACKTGGYVCMTCRHSPDNLEYITALERELEQMQDEGLWSRVAVTEVENFVRGVSAAQGDDYSSGYVYLYKKL